MRFAYVAAGAVVLGAAVSEARSVPSSPQRTPKSAKRQTRHAGLRAIQPLRFGNPAMMQASKALPSNTQLPDGISDDERVTQDGFPQLANMANPSEMEFPSTLAGDLLSASPVAPPSTGPPGVAEELEIMNINPTGVPEYVVMQAPITQGEMLRSDIPNAPRRYLPSPPLYMIENVGKALPEPASQALESVYSSLPPPIQKGPQRLPMPSENPMDALLEEIKQIANEQSTPSIPVTLPSGPPPPPLLRALDAAHVPVVPAAAITPSSNSTATSAENSSPAGGLATPLNNTMLPPQVPSPLARTAEITSNSTSSNNDTSSSSPTSALPFNQTAATWGVNATMQDSERATLTTANDTLTSPPNAVGSTNTTDNSTLSSSPSPDVNSTMGNNERATLTTPNNVTLSSPANATGSTDNSAVSSLPSPDVNSTMGDSERATLATPAGANDTLSNPSNGTDFSNATNATAAGSPPSLPKSPLGEE